MPSKGVTYTMYVHSEAPEGRLFGRFGGLLGTRGGCLVLESPDGNSWYPVVWPIGTRVVSNDPLILRLPSGEELSIGDQVTGGGGFHYRETLDVEIPRECPGESHQIAVFNADEELTKG